MWIDNKNLPKENGYYLTYYKNTEQNDVRFLYKAFYWRNRWIFRFNPDVICYWNVKHDYYVPCQIQPDVDPLPDIFKKKHN